MTSKQSSKRNSPAAEEKKGLKAAKPFDKAAMQQLQSTGRFRVVPMGYAESKKAGNQSRVITGAVGLLNRMSKEAEASGQDMPDIVYDFDHRLTGLQEDIDAFIEQKGVKDSLNAKRGTISIEKLAALLPRKDSKDSDIEADILREVKSSKTGSKKKEVPAVDANVYTMKLLLFSNIAHRSTNPSRQVKEQKSRRDPGLSLQDEVTELSDDKVLNITKVERGPNGWKGARKVKGPGNMKPVISNMEKVVVSPSQLSGPGVIDNIVAFLKEKANADESEVRATLDDINSKFATAKQAKEAAKKQASKRKTGGKKRATKKKST